MDILRFALLGLGTGAVYAMLAQGLVLVYRGSGLLNFSQGAMAMVGAYTYYEVSVRHAGPKWIGVLAAVALCAVLGALIHLLVLLPMRNSSALSRVIATLGITIILQAAAFLRYGHDPQSVPGILSTRSIHIVSHRLTLGMDRIEIFGIGLLLTVVLALVYRLTAFGRITAAVAETQLGAASLGHSPDRIAVCNWALGSAVAGLAGVLIAPIIFLEPTQLVLLVLPAMSAALVGRFASFPLTFAVAIGFGVVESEIERYVTSPGWPTAVPFIAVIAWLVARGQALPLRSYVLDRLPSVGTGRIRPIPTGIVVAVGILLTLRSGPGWAAALTTTFAVALICLSVVVITGYGGQLSLAQGALAGVGALIAAKLAPDMPFVLAFLLAVVATAAVGAIVAIPALRTRGVTLAIATLGLGAAISAVFLQSPTLTGGVAGISVPVPTAFGWSIDPFAHGNRYAFVTFMALVLAGLAVANLRRGSSGRRLLAVRSNERAAAALGVNNPVVKAYAFVIGAGIAAAGGVMLAFLQSSVEVSQTQTFTEFACILIVAVTVAGGVGSVGGAIVGSTMIAGSVASKLFDSFSRINDYLPLVGGIVLVLVLIFAPDGLFELSRRLLSPVGRLFERKRSAIPEHPLHDGMPASIRRVPPRALYVEDLSVAFGGVQALSGVTLDVQPGEVHGLIGPNGAGKTTFIDAVTGFVRVTGGTLRLADAVITGLAANRRAAAGLSRSFQSLELFDDLSVEENLAVASETPSLWRYLLDLVRPRSVRLSPMAQDALQRFELVELARRRPSDISFGQRKTVAIARAVATSPSIILLDEPGAGLDDHEAAELAELIRHLAHDFGIGVLLVEHNIDMIMSICDRVTVLDGGVVLTSASPAEVSTDDRILDAYLGSAPTSGATVA